jgi:hypothetical protein
MGRGESLEEAQHKMLVVLGVPIKGHPSHQAYSYNSLEGAGPTIVGPTNQDDPITCSEPGGGTWAMLWAFLKMEGKFCERRIHKNLIGLNYMYSI